MIISNCYILAAICHIHTRASVHINFGLLATGCTINYTSNFFIEIHVGNKHFLY